MQFDIIIFQTAIVISLLIFTVPMKLKYFTFLIPVLLLMGVSSVWATSVITLHQVKTIELSFQLLGTSPSFWSNVPTITIDKLSALFILMINLITIGSVIYSYGYLKYYFHNKSNLGISMHLFSFL